MMAFSASELLRFQAFLAHVASDTSELTAQDAFLCGKRLRRRQNGSPPQGLAHTILVLCTTPSPYAQIHLCTVLKSVATGE